MPRASQWRSTPACGTTPSTSSGPTLQTSAGSQSGSFIARSPGKSRLLHLEAPPLLLTSPQWVLISFQWSPPTNQAVLPPAREPACGEEQPRDRNDRARPPLRGWARTQLWGRSWPRYFFFTLVTGPRRSLRLMLSDTKVYEPKIRARLGTRFGRHLLVRKGGWKRCRWSWRRSVRPASGPPWR